jgi:hypothetical protein
MAVHLQESIESGSNRIGVWTIITRKGSYE